jgi:mono/diheme cytochrome c family protein
MRYVLALALAAGCGSQGTVPDQDPDAPTWHQDVAPLVGQHCSACHTDGAIGAPLVFDGYEATRPFGPIIRNAVATREMPPFMGQETAECTPDYPWMHDARLSTAEIETITAWVDAGMPEGDPASAAPIPEADQPRIEGPVQTLTPPSEYVVPPVGSRADIYTCISLDPGLLEDGWLQAFEVVPGDTRVVHHVLVGVDATGESGALAPDGGAYPCLGGFGVPANFIGGWVPGAAPVLMPERTAVRVPAGGRLVLQMHYHLIDEEVRDATGLKLKWADEPPERSASFGLFGNRNGLQPDPEDGGEARLFIPAGKKGHMERVILPWRVPTPVRVFMVWNHMHYVGSGMRVWVERAGQPPSCLLDTPEWDFNWQQSFFYDAAAGQAPLLLPGDELHLECIYDNTLDNPGVRKMLEEAGLDAPIDVSLGEGSLDEMCLVSLGVVPADLAPTHAGPATLTLSTADGRTDDRCQATAEAFVADGFLNGTVSCDVEALGQRRTLTATFTSAAGQGQPVRGTGTFALSGFAAGPADWTATWTGPSATVTMERTYAIQLSPLTIRLEGTLAPKR